MNTRTRFAAALAAISFVAVSVPATAIAASDPAATTPAVVAKPAVEKKQLSRKAGNMVWCVAPKGEVGAKKECKTRAKWVAEGKDPFNEY